MYGSDVFPGNSDCQGEDRKTDSIVSSVKKAIVPLAGLGTRLFPASFIIMKELFPVVGPDGVARALLHYNISEILDAGIEEICFIVQPGGEKIIREYFLGPGEYYIRKLEKYPALQKEVGLMQTFLERITFVTQHSQEGYGHAVYQARDFVGNHPCLLLLGDHLFRGNPIAPSVRLIQAWEKSHQLPMSAVNRIGPKDLKGYGTIAGKRQSSNSEIIDVSCIVEKPSIAVARQYLRVDGLEEDEFLGWFGMHILTSSLFEILGTMIQDNIRDNGEFQLTRAQSIHCDHKGYLAIEMSGCRRFDFGTPEQYVASLQEFSQPN